MKIDKIFFMFLFFLSNAFAEPTPSDIIKKADEVRFPQGDLSILVDVLDYSSSKLVRSTRYKVSSRGNEASLVETISPPRLKGNILLMLKEAMWLTTPNLRRPTRVSLQQKLTGEVANGDIARTNFSSDYSATMDKMEVLNGKKTYKLKLKAINKDVTYSALEYWVEKDTFHPIKVHFYALSGKLLKMGAYENYKLAADRKRPHRFIITDAVNKNKKSVLNYSQFKKEHFQDSLFNKEGLSQME